MRQTLFYIPTHIGDLPLLGWGLLLGLWVGLCVIFWLWRAWTRGLAEATGYLPVMLLVGAAIVLSPKAAVTMIRESASGVSSPGAEGIAIRGFGLMVLLGIASGLSLAVHQARKMNLNPDIILSLSIWVFVGGFGGARLFFVLQYWDQFQRETAAETLAAVANIAGGGIVLYGSLIGAVLAMLLFCRVHRLPLLALADLIAPSLVLGYAFGRIGCFLNGCCYGGVCELPWSVYFPAESPVWKRQVEEGQLNPHGLIFSETTGRPTIAEIIPGSPADRAGLKVGERIDQIDVQQPKLVGEQLRWETVAKLATQATGLKLELLRVAKYPEEARQVGLHISGRFQPVSLTVLPAGKSLPVHPTQLYSSLNAFLLALFLWSYYPLRRRDGEVVGLLLTIYPVSRFLIEQIRVDELGQLGTPLSISQLISVVLLVAMTAYWFGLLRSPSGSAFPLPGESESGESESGEPGSGELRSGEPGLQGPDSPEEAPKDYQAHRLTRQRQTLWAGT